MTEGSPVRVILLFALPILFGNIFQQLYNIVDTAVIGNVLGDTALAAVGATTAIYGLIIGFSNGMTNGFSVVLARAYGAGDQELMKKTVSMIGMLTLAASFLITVGAMAGLKPLLRFLHTPEHILEQSYTYVSIIFLFVTVTMCYNMFAGMLRAVGNSRIPLLFLIVATVINIVLDLLFVKVFSWGISGAAYATVIAQLISAVLCGIYIWKNCPLLRFDRRYLCFDRKLMAELITQGVSMGMMIAICSIGTVALQGAINSFGANIIAGHMAARKIAEMFMLPLGTLSTAAATYTSQNYGAGRNDRVKRGILASLGLAFLWSTISCLVTLPGAAAITRLLTGTTQAEVIHTTVQYIWINVPFYYFLSVLLILRSSLQGLGRKLVPLAASTMELAIKFAGAGWIAPRLGYLGICIMEPLIWGVCMVMVLIDFLLFSKKEQNSVF